MSCCGGAKRSNVFPMRSVRTSAAMPSFEPQTTVVIFRYIGRSSLTVYGPASGRKYWFRGQGTELAVDLRDRESMRDVPNIREVRLATV